MAAPTVNEQIADEATTHAINMLRVAANARASVLKELKRLEGSLVQEIASMTGDESVFKASRLNALLKQTRASINAAYDTISAQQQATLADVAGTEQAKAIQIVNNAIGIEAITVAMTEKQLETLASRALVQGQFAGKWWDKQAATLRERFLISMRDGMQRGEGVADLVRRVRGTKAAGFNDGVMALSRAQAEALVRTSVIAVSNLARIKTFLGNLDVIKAVQWRSTLDSRTTEICLALDGKQWSLPDFEPIDHALKWPGETAHWNCRSTQVAVTYSFAELAAREADEGATTGLSAADVIAKLGPDATAKEIADALIANARDAEVQVTGAVQAAIGDAGGKALGLEHAVKGADRLAEKLENKAALLGISPAEYAMKVGDTLRYTGVFTPAEYASGVKSSMQQLESLGYKFAKLENKWNDAGYKGLHLDVITPDGLKFELQFHTQQSLMVKNASHNLYEIQRQAATDAFAKKELQNKINDLWRAVELPSGVQDLR